MTPPIAAAANEPEPAPTTGAALVVGALVAHGVREVFGYPGGAIMPIYDALTGTPLRHILCRHEQGAGIAAQTYGRMTGRAGVCFATSGPGATNLVTAIADAFMDSVPMIAITGQVAQPIMGTDGFQEIDTFGITMPVVKHSYIVRNPADIPAVIAEAFDIAETGRPGPVVIDIPKDVQQAACEADAFMPRAEHTPETDHFAIARAERNVAGASKPLFYLGGGIVRAGAVEEVRALVERSGIPAVCTLMGNGILPSDHPLFLGMLGMHGSKAANLAVQECDELIVIGARFDDRATGALDTFAPHAGIIHFDRDIAEIHKLRHAHVAITGDLKPALESFNPEPYDMQGWVELNSQRKAQYAFPYDAPPGEGVFAPTLLKDLSEKAGDDFVVTCDVGQHQMWVAQHCRFSRPQAHITSGGLGTMGFGMPAGIGALFAEPQSTVVTVTGDGSFMMNIQELATLKRYKIPLKIVLLNNSRLGMVRQWQELFFDANYSEVDLSDNPDFAEVARAFGIEAFTIESRDQVEAGLDRLLAADGPILAHVIIDPAENVWPLVPPGKSNADMLER